MRIIIATIHLFLLAAITVSFVAAPADAQRRKRKAAKKVERVVKKADEKPAKPFKADAAYVVLQGLDKETARILTFGGRVGQTVRFRTLRIVIRRCQKTPPDQPPEKAAFLQIYDVNPVTKKRALVFSGWMFKSKPALSAMDHAVYDVWVKDCK